MINLMNLLSIKISVIMGMEEITEEIKTTIIFKITGRVTEEQLRHQ